MNVRTRKLPATDTQGARIRAKSDAGKQVTISYPYAAHDPHEAAVRALVGDTPRVTFLRETEIGQVWSVAE